jgi:hypothetical protein
VRAESIPLGMLRLFFNLIPLISVHPVCD